LAKNYPIKPDFSVLILRLSGLIVRYYTENGDFIGASIFLAGISQGAVRYFFLQNGQDFFDFFFIFSAFHSISSSIDPSIVPKTRQVGRWDVRYHRHFARGKVGNDTAKMAVLQTAKNVIKIGRDVHETP